MGDVMSVIFNLLLHALLLGSMGIFAWVLVATALRTESASEKIKRVLALFLGAIIVIGAQVSGVGFAEFTAGALGNARVFSAGAVAVTTLVPVLAGAGLGFLLVYTYSKNEVLAMRILCLVGMLALVSFIEVYAIATQARGVFLGVSAVPNISFIAGVGLVFIFSPDAKGKTSLRSVFNSTFRRKSSGSGAPESASATTDGRVRDPFDI